MVSRVYLSLPPSRIDGLIRLGVLCSGTSTEGGRVVGGEVIEGKESLASGQVQRVVVALRSFARGACMSIKFYIND